VIWQDSPRSDQGRAVLSSLALALAEQLRRRAMLMAIRRASSFVSILACSASVGFSRE
jgi:hypothetical protein